MKCEECGGVMVWRCTDNITRLSKWKCRDCGHLQFEDYVPVKLPKKEPKHYTFSHGKYDVKKRINGHQYYLACFKSEDMAKKFVALMKASEWDLSRVVEFKEACQV